MKRLLGLTLLIMISGAAIAQKSYQIKIQLNGFKEHSLLLASYYGDKIRLVDTAKAVEPGVFVFTGDKPLTGGIYMTISPEKKKLFEFVINKNQQFALITDTANYALDMKVENSLENQLFFNYLKFSEKQYKESMAIEKKRNEFKKDDKDYKELTSEMDSLKKIASEYRDRLRQEHPKTFVAEIFRAMSETEKAGTENPKTKEAFYQLKDQYWDHFALNDPRMFRTPLYERKINIYFQDFVPMQPDSVDKAIDIVIRKAEPCTECVSFLVWKFTVEYQNPKYMGFDKVFVHMVDQYFDKESIQNTTPSILKLLKKRADELRPLLLGNKAPELVLMDTTGRYVGFESLPNRYTLLLFWDYNCGVCRQEMKELVPFYNKYAKKYDLAIYGININPDLANWKKAVKDRQLHWINVNGTRSIKGDYTKTYNIHGTPQFFLLDKNKRIIAKQFSVSQLKMILDDFTKKSDSK
ncbi:MAG: redoxin domain-containing protein [Bacteroidales bacterium]|nr:redoxin domain-containing protein [Bacteroidales bacterium]